MTNKIKFLIAINIILIAAISFSLKTTTKNSTLNNLNTQFALADSSLAYRIVLGEQSFVKQEDHTWQINETYKVDAGKAKSLLALLQRISIKRPASEQVKTTIQQELINSGLPVRVLDQNGQELQSFKMVTKDDETYAAINGSEPFIIHIPGVAINLAEWLTANEISWRDRQVMYTTWRTLKELQVNYYNDSQNSFQITFENNFYNVAGINQLDSGAVYEYLVRFQDFKANRFIADRPQLADSLKQLKPLCTIAVEDLYSERNNTLQIYPTQETLYGVLEKNTEVVEISPRMLETILVPKAMFEKKEQ